MDGDCTVCADLTGGDAFAAIAEDVALQGGQMMVLVWFRGDLLL